MSQVTSLDSLRTPAQATPATPVSVGMDTVQGFEALQRISKLFAASAIVPQTYRDNLPNTVIAVDMAMRMGANPLMVMQNLYVVHGRPAWSAQFLIATFNKSGKFSALRYEFSGKEGKDDRGCTAVAVELSTGQTLYGPKITIELAKKEGWFGKSGSKWQTMPELMLRYRAAAWFVRSYAPEIAMGLQTAEEVRDTFDLEKTADGSFSVTTEDIINGTVVSPEQAGTETLPEAEAAPEPTPDPAPRSGFQITCPKNGNLVDGLDCSGKPCRDGCPEFED